MGTSVAELYRVDPSDGELIFINRWDNWNDYWHSIVSSRLGFEGTQCLFFFDREHVQALIHTLTPDGNLHFVREVPRRELEPFFWDLVVPGPFVYSEGPVRGNYSNNGLLLYHRGSGFAVTMALGSEGDLAVIDTFKGWRDSWDSIVGHGSIHGPPGFFFYDKSNGDLAFYDYHTRSSSSPGHLASPHIHSVGSWDLMVAIPLRNYPDEGRVDQVLFLNRGDGQAALYRTDDEVGLILVRRYALGEWGGSWDIIVPGQYLVGVPSTQLLAYSRTERRLQLINLESDGAVTRGAEFEQGERQWSQIVRGPWIGDADHLLFYRSEAE